MWVFWRFVWRSHFWWWWRRELCDLQRLINRVAFEYRQNDHLRQNENAPKSVPAVNTSTSIRKEGLRSKVVRIYTTENNFNVKIMDSDPDQSFDKEKLEPQIKLDDGDRYGRFIEFCRKYYGKLTKNCNSEYVLFMWGFSFRRNIKTFWWYFLFKILPWLKSANHI